MESESKAELKVVNNERTSFFQELLVRRVPQFLGGYLAASWIIVEFIDWLVNRYPISPYLVEFGLVALVSLIPTVALIAYFHGKPGRDRWTITEKVGIPTNLMITVLLLVFVFQGKELGATTTTVTVTTENGEEIERIIPKSEFRKRIAMFPFENNTGEASYDWMKNAMPDMIQFDLIQDVYMDIVSPYSTYSNIKEAGLDPTARIPMALKKKITGELHMDYFTSGAITESDGQLSVTISLHNASTAKSIAENTIAANDIFLLVDKVSIQLKNDLEIPKVHVQETEDLPISEMMTYSLSALEKFYSANNIIILEDDWFGGIELLEQSIKEDDAFAVAYLNLYMLYLWSNQSEKFVMTFEPLMTHLYKIPERFQFAVKHDYYQLIKQDPEMAFSVGKNWVELYPDDLKAHTVLARLYQMRGQTDMVLEEYKTILRLDPGKHELLIEIGDLYKNIGDFDMALNYYNQYLEKNPNSLTSHVEIGNLYKLNGDYENAKKSFNKALLIEPENLDMLLSLADIEKEIGQFSPAHEQYLAALESAKSEEEKTSVYQKLENYYLLRGQVTKSFKEMERRFSVLEKIAPPLALLDSKSESLNMYILNGKTDDAFQLVSDAESMLAPPMDKMIPFMYLNIYLKLEDVVNSEKYLVGAEEAIEALQIEIIRHTIFEAKGKIHELKGEYELALENYEQQLQLEPNNFNIHIRLGRCHRNLKEYGKAESRIMETLSIHPFWPKANYELALVYAESGKKAQAIEYLKIAIQIWEEADPDFKPAILAREKLAEMD